MGWAAILRCDRCGTGANSVPVSRGGCDGTDDRDEIEWRAKKHQGWFQTERGRWCCRECHRIMSTKTLVAQAPAGS